MFHMTTHNYLSILTYSIRHKDINKLEWKTFVDRKIKEAAFDYLSQESSNMKKKKMMMIMTTISIYYIRKSETIN